MNPFKNLDHKQFLQNHWEKSPLVIKGFLKQAESLLDEEDLVNMAMEEYFETRVVAKNQNQFTVKHGPFESEEEIKNWDEWTLINHNVDLYSKELMELKKGLEFLPAWLFDDAMTTYSNANSTVGAHIDNYNVFIIQLKGQRQWNIQHNPNPEYQEGLDIKILKEFKPQESYILNPGDMIYIPPHVAHEGISQTESLSLSLGFKSLEDKALVEQFAIELVNNFQSEDFYKTSFACSVEDPYIIDEKIINETKQRIMQQVLNSTLFENALLKFTSASKRPTTPVEAEFNDFLTKAKKLPLFKDEFVRISAFKKESGGFKVAVNDFDFIANSNEYSFIKSLAYMTCEEELNLNDFPSFEQLIFKLFKQGMLFFNEY